MLLKLLLLIFIITNAKATFSQEQWYSTTVPRNRHVNSLKFLSHDDILFGGGNEFNGSLQELWLSHDKGLEWENINNVHTEAWIKSMAFIDTLQGFAVGDSATILKTINGSYFWTLLPRPIQNREFNKIIYVTPQILFIVGGSIPYPDMFVTNPDTMQTIVKSTDGGNTWNVMLDRKGFWLNGVSFTDTLHGNAVGDNGTILKTIDGGVNWNTITSPVPRNLKAVRFINPSIGYAVGGKNSLDFFSHSIDSFSTILRTNNGGNSWNVIKDDVAGILNDITFTNDSTGYIVGDKATLLKTTNSGSNWSPVTVPGATGDQTFNCVEFKNDHLGMIGANGGYMHVYTHSSLAAAYTLGSRYVDSTTFTLFGGVNTHGEVASYNFLFSLDSTFVSYNVITPYPGAIQSDSIVMIQSDFPGLIQDTTYYFIFQVRTLAGFIYGDTLSFSTKAPKYTFQTLPAANVTTFSGLLNGFINKLPTAATLSFEYGTNPLLGNEIAAVPATINDTLSHTVTAFLNNLESKTNYYFRLKGFHNGQSYYGDIQVLSTLDPIQTLAASGITDTSAILNGFIDKLGTSATISFEYGTTPSFGNEVAAFPGIINDTLSHSVSAAIDNLLTYQTYYYRLKAVHNSKIYYGGTQMFFSGAAYKTFQTLPPSNIHNLEATFNGTVDRFIFPVNLSFEYGNSPALGFEIVANPANINDTLQHAVSATLSNLSPVTPYYYRLKGQTSAGTFYGDIVFFNSDLNYRIFLTNTATGVTNTSATLNGYAEAVSLPVNLSFEYGTSSVFLDHEIPATPSTINDTLQHTIVASINGLLPSTQYYFRLKGQTTSGIYYGGILPFKTGSYFLFETSPASEITTSSAKLNGMIDKSSYPFILSFDYGRTETFGSSIPANPPSINDTFQHAVSATLNGLIQDQGYYFRLKGISGTDTTYGDTLIVFPGFPEIPNWDFQFWKTDTANIPKYWNSVSEDFERVPGHSGNYAIKISNQNILLNGSIKQDLGGGVPLNGVIPDSIVAFLNYFVEAGDSALMGVILMKHGQPVAQNLYPIAGNSNGLFERKAFKINYDSLVVPDTVINLFVSTNLIDRQSPFHNNFLIVDDISFVPGNTTFANSGFESWFTSVIEHPLGWFAFQYMGLDSLHPENHNVSKVFFNAPNDFAAQITNENVDGMGVLPGILAIHNGVLDNKNGGFPVKGKHLTLNGYYKFFPAPGDTMRISISMKKDSGIGNADFFQSDSVPDFTPFSIPIIYTTNNVVPDSADLEITCSISNPKPGTKVVIDKLSFDGFISGVQTTKTDLLQLDGMKVFPNPARDFLIIENLFDINKECSLSLLNVTGQLVREIKLPAGQRTAQMEVGDLAPGFYVLIMKKGDNNYSKKIVIQK